MPGADTRWDPGPRLCTSSPTKLRPRWHSLPESRDGPSARHIPFTAPKPPSDCQQSPARLLAVDESFLVLMETETAFGLVETGGCKQGLADGPAIWGG